MSSGEPRPAVASVQRDATPTRPLPQVQAPRRRRRRWPLVLLAVLLLIAGLAVLAYVIADGIVRQRAEAQIEQTVAASLPDGVTGRVDATIDGRWVLPQLLAGEFDHVTLVSKGLRVASAPAKATVQLYGLPTDGGTVTQTTAELTVGQAAFRGLPALQKVRATDPTIGRNSVSTVVQQTVLGIPVRVRVALKPTLSGQVVQLDPTDAKVIAGPLQIPATPIVRQLLPNGVSVCAAQYLPRGVSLDYLRTQKGSVTVGLDAFQVDLNTLDTAPKGTCG